MYDLKKRAFFETLGELRMLLADMPDDTDVCTGGVLGSWLHFDENKTLVSFDDDSLYSDYCDDLEKKGIEDPDKMEDYYDYQQRLEHQQRIEDADCDRFSYPQNLIYDCLDY